MSFLLNRTEQEEGKVILVLGRFQTLWHKGNQSSGRQRQQQQEEEEEEYGRLINWRRKDEEDKKNPSRRADV